MFASMLILEVRFLLAELEFGAAKTGPTSVVATALWFVDIYFKYIQFS